ncbi:MAG: signal peptidase I [Ruminococcus sp.]|nr:signal peptidase I [Ruminococcus sp.]
MKKALKITFNILSWIVLIFALIITLLVFTADRNNGVSTLLGFMPFTVESDSMKPTFEKNDLIICREVDDINSLAENDVITFWTIIDGKKVKNTHRIVEVCDSDSTKSFITRGDNNGANDDISVYPADIIGKWTNVKISGFGKVMSFLRTKTGFFICILIPMALFFLFELYKMIVTIIEIKRPALSAADEEEIKRKAVEEYLKEQQNAKENTPEKSGE